MEILPGIGIDKVIFGLTHSEVIDILNRPDKIYKTDEGCTRLQFYYLQIECSFEPENEDRLSWIEVHNKNVYLFDEQLIDSSYSEVEQFLTSRLGEHPEIEDYGSFVALIYNKNWVELQFSFGVLKNINFGVLYNNYDEPIWPDRR